MARSRTRLALAAAAALVACGCSFNYDAATVAESLGQEIPDTVLERFSQTVVRDGKPQLVLEAAEARTFRVNARVLLASARFREYDSAGELSVQGSAEHAVFHTDTENAELSGGIVLHSARDKATVRTTVLDWDRAHRFVHGDPDAAVIVEKDDGSRLQGTGFEADFRTHTIRFSGGVSGTIITEDSKETP
jgi:LPS export ABC transporter protein LptC